MLVDLLSGQMWLSVSSSSGRVRNYDLKLLGVHTAAYWRLSVSGLLGSIEVVAFGNSTGWLCDKALSHSFVRMML